MLDEKHGPPHNFSKNAADENDYTWGKIGDHNVVITCLSQYGKVGAATTAFGMRASLPHLKFGLMVGIGAGVPRVKKNGKVALNSDIRLGDVVVSYPMDQNPGVVQYDLEKLKRDGQRERTGSLNRPPEVLLKGLQTLQAQSRLHSGDPPISKVLGTMWTKYPVLTVKDPESHLPAFTHQGSENDLLFPTSYPHPSRSPDDDSDEIKTCGSCDETKAIQRDKRVFFHPKVYYGTIASGDKLVKDGIERQKILDGLDDTCLCFEMEAAGLMNHFPCLIIRGICNYADSHNNNVWQPYAAATAAAFAKVLLYTLEGTAVANESSSIGETLDKSTSASRSPVDSALDMSY